MAACRLLASVLVALGSSSAVDADGTCAKGGSCVQEDTQQTNQLAAAVAAAAPGDQDMNALFQIKNAEVIGVKGIKEISGAGMKKNTPVGGGVTKGFEEEKEAATETYTLGYSREVCPHGSVPINGKDMCEAASIQFSLVWGGAHIKNNPRIPAIGCSVNAIQSSASPVAWTGAPFTVFWNDLTDTNEQNPPSELWLPICKKQASVLVNKAAYKAAYQDMQITKAVTEAAYEAYETAKSEAYESYMAEALKTWTASEALKLWTGLEATLEASGSPGSWSQFKPAYEAYENKARETYKSYKAAEDDATTTFHARSEAYKAFTYDRALEAAAKAAEVEVPREGASA